VTMKAVRVALYLIVPGIFSVIYWLNRYPFIARELSLGDKIPVWLIAAIIFSTPFLILLGVAAIYKYFHDREGHSLTKSEAYFKIILASTPFAVNAIALLILENNYTDTYASGPFNFFLAALMLYEPILGSHPLPALLSNLWWLTINYGAAWVAFFLIYIKLSKISKKRLILAILVTSVFVTVVELARMFVLDIWIT